MMTGSEEEGNFAKRRDSKSTDKVGCQRLLLHQMENLGGDELDSEGGFVAKVLSVEDEAVEDETVKGAKKMYFCIAGA